MGTVPSCPSFELEQLKSQGIDMERFPWWAQVPKECQGLGLELLEKLIRWENEAIRSMAGIQPTTWGLSSFLCNQRLEFWKFLKAMPKLPLSSHLLVFKAKLLQVGCFGD